MTDQLVREWLSDYAAITPVELQTFIASLEHNQDLVSALHTVIDNREHYQKLIDLVYNQLFAFYRSREVELQRFTLQFVPSLIYVYLNSVACGKKKTCWSLETLLVGLYNLEVVDENGQPRVVSFRLPSLAQPSIYHELMHLDPATLTQKELRRLEECNTKLISWGPLPQVETLNAQNRLKVMTALLFVFNRHLSRFHKSALEKLCRVCSRLTAQGFSRPGIHQQQSGTITTSPRIPVSTQFLLELLHAVYFAMFNEFSSMAVQALEDVHFRGCYECFAEVILVTGAIRNSIKDTPKGQALEGPMGISMAVSPATNTVTVSKSMITNASFRTKKLPDDLDEELVANLTASQQELGQRRKDGNDASPEAPVRPARNRKSRGWRFANKASVEDDLAEGKNSEEKDKKASPKKPSSRRDDIPIQQPADGAAAGDGKDSKNLMAISEEKEEEPAAGSERLTPRGSSLRAASGLSLPKLPNLQAIVGGKRGKAKEGGQERKVTPPQQQKSVTKLPVINGDSFEMDVRKKSNSENGNLAIEEEVGSLDLVDKRFGESLTPILGSLDGTHNNGGPASDSVSLLTADSGDSSFTNTGEGDVGTGTGTPLLNQKNNTVEIEPRGSMQISTV